MQGSAGGQLEPRNFLHMRPDQTKSSNLEVAKHLEKKTLFTLLDLCVSSLRRGHANLLCIVPILFDDPRRESNIYSKCFHVRSEQFFQVSKGVGRLQAS